MSVPNGTPGASPEPASSDVAVAAIAETPPETLVATGEGGGADIGLDGGNDAAAVAEDIDAEATARAEDDADLAQYPEDVREHFKSLKPEVRKSLFEHAEANAREGLKAVQAREQAIADADAAKAKLRADIVAKIGKYVGDEPITKIGRDGIERVLPSFEETQRLNQNQRGRSELWQKYSLDEDGIEDHLENLTERRQMLDDSTDFLEDRALGRIDQRMIDGFKEAGLDPDLRLQATRPEEIVPVVVKHLRAQHDAEMKKQKDGYEARLGAVNANAEGMRGKVLAATGRPLAEGGRTSGVSDVLTPETYAAMPYAERMQLRSTPEGRARIDAMTSGRR